MALMEVTTSESLSNRTTFNTVRDDEDNVLAITGRILELAKKMRKFHFERYAALFELNADKKLLHRLYIDCESKLLVFETTAENSRLRGFGDI